MDTSKPRSRGRRRVALAPGLESLEGRRLLAAGPAQVRVQEANSGGMTALVITGTNGPDSVLIRDNGTGMAGNVSVTLGNGTTYTAKGAITMIQFQGRAGNDQVEYQLTGNLVSARALSIDLGAGDDRFRADLAGNIDTTDGLDLEAYGDAGNDNLMVVQTGATLAGTVFPYLEGDAGNDTLTYLGSGYIAPGATVGPGLPGGAGNDTITDNYAGRIDGMYLYSLTADGGAGNDNIAVNVALGAGSKGKIGAGSGTVAAVVGGAGNDQIRYAVAAAPTSTAQVSAFVSGGTGADSVQRTANIQDDSTAENDAILV